MEKTIWIFLFILTFYAKSVSAQNTNLNPYYQSLFGNGVFPNQESQKSKDLANACSKKCDSYENTKVCLISEELKKENIYGKNPASCDGADTIRYIESPSEIVAALTEVAKNCKRISKLIFHGHGNNLEIAMNTSVDKNSWSSLSKNLSCVLQDNVEIDFRSCNIGNGCDGQMQMYQIAKAFLSDKKGTVRAPTSLAVADKFGLAKATSINGKDRLLEYDGKKQTIKWGYDGLLITGWKTATNVCLDELAQISNRIKFFEKKLKMHRCSANEFTDRVYGIRDAISEFQNDVKKKPPPNNVVNFLPSSDSTLYAYQYWLEKHGIKAISNCLKDNYWKKIKNSLRHEDQDYLKALEESDDSQKSTDAIEARGIR